MAKYDPLGDPLRRQPAEKDAVQMSFRWIEEVLGVARPTSGRRHLEWWPNEAAGAHVQAHSWLSAN